MRTGHHGKELPARYEDRPLLIEVTGHKYGEAIVVGSYWPGLRTGHHDLELLARKENMPP